MSNKKKNAAKHSAPPAANTLLNLKSGVYFKKLLNIAATLYLAITVVVLPMYMDRQKYASITLAKNNFFNILTIVFVFIFVLLLFAMLMYVFDEEGFKKKLKSMTLRQHIARDPMLVADIAIVAYWLLMLISCLLSEDRVTAFQGLAKRDNGFLYQTLYVFAYFAISRAMKPAAWKSMIFVWGGAILAVVCILHYYGVDIYDVVHYSYYSEAFGEWKDAKLASSYAGPFWDSSSYRFLGPVGNVNLGSYILAVALVIAAGLYITGVLPRFWKVTDKYGISLAVCFAVILFAELNINTDAGLVAMAAAVLAIPIVLCGSLERLGRALTIFAIAAGTVLLDLSIDRHLRGEDFGTTGTVLVVMTIVLAALAAAAILLKNNEKLQKLATAKNLRTAMVTLAVLAVIGGVSLSLIITQPDEPAAGALSGATQVISANDLEEKSDTIIHELGQILRGNFDDSFGHNRLFTWKRTLSLVKHHPFFGIGPDNFADFFAKYYRAEAVAMFPSSDGNLDKAHNEYLDILLSNGILGLAAHLTFLGALLYGCFRKADKRTLAPAFGVTVISYMAHAFFGYQLPIHSPVMWMMLGAAAAYARSELSDTEESVSK